MLTHLYCTLQAQGNIVSMPGLACKKQHAKACRFEGMASDREAQQAMFCQAWTFKVPMSAIHYPISGPVHSMLLQLHDMHTAGMLPRICCLAQIGKLAACRSGILWPRCTVYDLHDCCPSRIVLPLASVWQCKPARDQTCTCRFRCMTE